MSAGMAIVTEAGGYVVPPCPAWCELTATHDMLGLLDGVDEEPGVALSRSHSTRGEEIETLDIHRGLVDIVQGEEINTLTGEVFVDAESIWISEVESLTADQARRLANALTAAADHLDEITRSSSRRMPTEQPRSV